MERNGRARALRASADCVEAWRQVLEVLLTAVPTQLLTEHPDQVVMDVSRHILDKVRRGASMWLGLRPRRPGDVDSSEANANGLPANTIGTMIKWG